jgi:hypothetical protein
VIARRHGLPLSIQGCVLRRLGLSHLESLDTPASAILEAVLGFGGSACGPCLLAS